MTAPVLEVKPEAADSLVQEVNKRSGQNLQACYQCRRCAAGCAVGDETGNFTPDLLIRMVILGDRTTALNNELIWKCVSCHTCGTRCPNGIQTGKITATLKKMSREACLEPLNPRVNHFHDSFLEECRRWGRLNELGFMGLYELKNTLTEAKRRNPRAIIAEIREQARLGLSMLRQKRLHLGFHTISGRNEIKRLYKKADRKIGS